MNMWGYIYIGLWAAIGVWDMWPFIKPVKKAAPQDGREK